MNARAAALRLPFAIALAILGTILLAGSSLAKLLPVRIEGTIAIYAALALLAALTPAILAHGSPLPRTLALLVPVLGFASYGASRLDWLRLLKDFGVAETAPLQPLRLGLALATLLLAWTMHAADLALRLRERSLARGAPRAHAAAAARVTLTRSAQAAALATAGALVLLGVAIVGALLSRVLPVERAAFVAPLLAALLLAAAGAWLARGRASEP